MQTPMAFNRPWVHARATKWGGEEHYGTSIVCDGKERQTSNEDYQLIYQCSKMGNDPETSGCITTQILKGYWLLLGLLLLRLH